MTQTQAIEVPELPLKSCSVAEHCQALRAARTPTLPSTIGQELMINPFLRTETAAIRESAESVAGHRLANGLEIFTQLRRWKDGFTG